MHNFAAHLLLELAPKWPERTAARCLGRSLTYAELARLSLAMAGLLRAKGLTPADRVLIVLPDSFSFLAAFLGCLLAGGEAVPFNPRLPREDYDGCLRSTAPLLVLAAPGHIVHEAARQAGVFSLALEDAFLADLLADIAPGEPYPATPDSPCALFVTSGTTGHPKLVPHPHGHFFAVAAHLRDFLRIRPNDVVLSSSKLFHVYGMFATLTVPLSSGAASILEPDKPSGLSTLDVIDREGVSYLLSVPVIYGMMLLAMTGDRPIPRLRTSFCAGEVLPEALFLAWREKTGQDIWQGYGSTEAMCFIIGNRAPDIVPGTAGRLLPPFEALILDPGQRPVAPGTPGHLAMRGPSVMSGYLGAPEWNAKIFTRDGFLFTGDMAVEKDGVYTILGRMDDMFKAGGLWVPPIRVENALLTHPGVAQCAVTGGMAGAFTLVRAHVVPKAGFDPGQALADEIKRFTAGLLPDYMVPTDVVFTESLPLTASGKVQRYKLRRDAG